MHVNTHAFQASENQFQVLDKETISAHKPVLLASPHFSRPSHIPLSFPLFSLSPGRLTPVNSAFSSPSASLGLAIGWTAGREKRGAAPFSAPRVGPTIQCSNDCLSKNIAAGVWSPTSSRLPIKPREPGHFSSCCSPLGVSESLGALWVPHCSVQSLCIMEVVALDELVFPKGSDT